MRINYIKLKNYRQYKDTTIKFTSSETKKNFTIIEGGNGAGKSNILNAITWCLYGEEIHLKEEEKGLPIANTLALDELKPKESCEVLVEIQMKDEGNNDHLFKRILRFQKLPSGEIEKFRDSESKWVGGTKFEYWRQEGKDMTHIDDPDFFIPQMMPEDIKEYFFFDGERLNLYFKEASGEKIKKAVFDVSQIDLLERVIERLNDKKKELLRECKSLSPEVERIKEELEIYEKSLNNYREELIKLRSDLREAESNKKQISAELRTYPDITELEDERNQIKEDLNKLEEGINTLNEERFNYLLRMAPVIFANDAINKTIKLVQGKKEAGDIPPKYKKTFIEELLKKGKCICGADITKDSKYRENVKKFLEEADILSDVSEELIETNATLRNMLEKLPDFETKQISFGKRIRDLENQINGKSRRLEIINKKVGGAPSERIRKKEKELEEYEEKISDTNKQIGMRETRIQEAEKIIKRLGVELENELKKAVKDKLLKKVVSFCETSSKAAESIRNEMINEVRKKIEEKTKKQFFDLIWKKESYKDVVIDEEYNISVLHQSGREGIGTLSAGERQVLALSFMAALNSVSGFKAPIVIDTPLGRISKEPKKNIANNLPTYLEGSQVTLLVTEEEYTPEVRKKLLPRVGAEYMIKFRELKDGCDAKVVPYER